MIKTGVFKYETHVHTKYASACSGTGAREMVNAHIEAGYQGMILTEHVILIFLGIGLGRIRLSSY